MCYHTLAGIQPEPTRVKAHYDSVRSRIAVAWRLEHGRFLLDVTVPANTTATVHIPCTSAASVTEQDCPAREAPGIKFVTMNAGAAIFTVSGGTYHFAEPDQP